MGKGLEGNGRGLVQGIIPEFASRDGEESRKTSVRTACVQAWI